MPKLPNADVAFIDPAKFADYLLNPAHRVGTPKLRFLEQFGFSRTDPDAIAAALMEHARTHEASVISTRFGVKYQVDGPLVTPTGEGPWIRTVWQIDDGAAIPRFITLKPLRKRP